MSNGAESRGDTNPISRSEGEIFDWRPSDWDWQTGLSVGILVQDGQVFEEQEYYEDELPQQIASELQDLTQAARVHVTHIDPTVGAGTNGLAFLLQFLDMGADVINWSFAVTALAPKIRKAIVRLRHLAKDEQASSVTISLTAEALQVLVADEVCSRYGIDPSAILPLKCLSHEIEPPETRLELKQLFAAHTIAVEAIGDDHYHHVWIYTVSARGLVLAESEVKVPIPNATQWGWPEPTKGRPLETL